MPLDEHDFDEDAEHDPDECELCLEQNQTTTCECRCGNCCRYLILETTLRDAEREPRIAAECESLREIGSDVIGYLLNDRQNGGACHFFDAEAGCTIHETRPLMCRLFDCDSERRSGDLAQLLNHES